MQHERERKYWLGVVSKSHVENGIREGICQVCHGKKSGLQRMKKGDFFVYYSPTLTYGKKDMCQSFTAIGHFIDDDIYTYDMGGGFVPFRRKISYWDSCEAGIRPLIPMLSFIRNKEKWGMAFRFGLLSIPKEDFEYIAKAMNVEIKER